MWQEHLAHAFWKSSDFQIVSRSYDTQRHDSSTWALCQPATAWIWHSRNTVNLLKLNFFFSNNTVMVAVKNTARDLWFLSESINFIRLMQKVQYGLKGMRSRLSWMSPGDFPWPHRLSFQRLLSWCKVLFEADVVFTWVYLLEAQLALKAWS